MESDERFPLPTKQYRWYVLFFHVLTLGSLVGALVHILWNARHALGWTEVAVSVLLLAQIGIYLGLMILGRQWPLPRNQLLLYFAVNLAMWLIVVLAGARCVLGCLCLHRPNVRPAAREVRHLCDSVCERDPVCQKRQLALCWIKRNISSGNAGRVGNAGGVHAVHQPPTQASQERGRLIAELQAAKKELELAKQREAELAVLRERERLARDLHDSLGHALVTLSVQLEAIQRLYRVDPEAASDQVDEMKAMTRSSMDGLRRSIAGLRAPGLEDRALRPALQALCVDFAQRTGLEVACQIDEVADRSSPGNGRGPVAHHTGGADKRGKARPGTLSRRVAGIRTRAPLALRIVDDGVGLAAGAESLPNRFGIRGMRERVEGLGGTLALDGGTNGTTVEARLPLIRA